MFETITRARLLSFLADDGVQMHGFLDHRGNLISGIIQSIERESGSGFDFNVTLIDDVTKKRVTHYVRCSR